VQSEGEIAKCERERERERERESAREREREREGEREGAGVTMKRMESMRQRQRMAKEERARGACDDRKRLKTKESKSGWSLKKHNFCHRPPFHCHWFFCRGKNARGNNLEQMQFYQTKNLPEFKTSNS
jgi:hypothetical protein